MEKSKRDEFRCPSAFAGVPGREERGTAVEKALLEKHLVH